MDSRITAAMFAFGMFYAWQATPIYRADALVQVEQNASTIPGLEEVTMSVTGSSYAPASTEIEIIKSRSVVGRAVRDLGLDTQAMPRRFPVIGGAVARRYRSGEISKALPGFRRFWNGNGQLLSVFQTVWRT